MGKLTLVKFEAERQAGIKCVNIHCKFCMAELDIVCDAIDEKGGDPSYANCLTYLPEKLIIAESLKPSHNRQSESLLCPRCGSDKIANTDMDDKIWCAVCGYKW